MESVATVMQRFVPHVKRFECVKSFFMQASMNKFAKTSSVCGCVKIFFNRSAEFFLYYGDSLNKSVMLYRIVRQHLINYTKKAFIIFSPDNSSPRRSQPYPSKRTSHLTILRAVQSLILQKLRVLQNVLHRNVHVQHIEGPGMSLTRPLTAIGFRAQTATQAPPRGARNPVE